MSADPAIRASLISTLIAALACVSTHLIAIAGFTGAIAWLSKIEHALLFLSIALAALTFFFVLKHRRQRHHNIETPRREI